jgi:Tfp pilus assembly protein PilF
VYEIQKDHQQAIDAYRRALELEGNKSEIMISLARVYLRSGQYTAAKELLAAVLEMEPNNALAHQYMGFAHLRLKETEEAIASYTKAVEADPNDYMAYKSLGVAYMIQYFSDRNPATKARGLEAWGISLQLNPDQPQLQKFYEQYQ